MIEIIVDKIVPEPVYIPRAIRQLSQSELAALYQDLLNNHHRTKAQEKQLAYVHTEYIARYEGTHKIPPSRAGYVYIVRAGDYYKIGRTRNVEKRILSLQTASPWPVLPVFIIETSEAAIVEKSLHRKYAHVRMSGEWYGLSDDDIAEIIASYPGGAA